MSDPEPTEPDEQTLFIRSLFGDTKPEPTPKPEKPATGIFAPTKENQE